MNTYTYWNANAKQYITPAFEHTYIPYSIAVESYIVGISLSASPVK